MIILNSRVWYFCLCVEYRIIPIVFNIVDNTESIKSKIFNGSNSNKSGVYLGRSNILMGISLTSAEYNDIRSIILNTTLTTKLNFSFQYIWSWIAFRNVIPWVAIFGTCNRNSKRYHNGKFRLFSGYYHKSESY